MKKAHAAILGTVVSAFMAAGCGNENSAELVPSVDSVAAAATAGTTSTPPTVQLVVYNGATTEIAGCSEPTCLGGADGSDPTPGTGIVTYQKNNVGWAVNGGLKGSVYLYVDGARAAAVKPPKLLVWSATPGTHVVQTMAFNSSGVAGWSAPVTITAQ